MRGALSFLVMTFRKSQWLAAVAAVSGAAIMVGGCGGSTDSTTSTEPAQAAAPAHAVPLEHPSRQASEGEPAKRHKRASSHLKHKSPQESKRATKPHSAPPSHQASPAALPEDAVAKVKELIGGSGGGKQRTVSTPKQIHKALQEIHDQSGQPGDQTSGSQGSGSGGSGSPSGVEEILESLGGN
jgi:hypothetical protein